MNAKVFCDQLRQTTCISRSRIRLIHMPVKQYTASVETELKVVCGFAG